MVVFDLSIIDRSMKESGLAATQKNGSTGRAGRTTGIYEDTRPSDLQLEQFLTYRLLTLTNRLNQQAVRILDALAGLRLPEWRCLAFIANQNRISLNGIAERTGIDRGLISRSVQGLVTKGHVLVERDTADRRLVHAIVTREGERLYRRVLPVMQGRQARLLGALSEAERRTLFRSIDKLNACLDDWPEAGR